MCKSVDATNLLDWEVGSIISVIERDKIGKCAKCVDATNYLNERLTQISLSRNSNAKRNSRLSEIVDAEIFSSAKIENFLQIK